MAEDVIARIRALASKAPPRSEPLDMFEIICESVALVAHEARSADTQIGVMLYDVPRPFGDRVQIQQVLVNLLLNSIQAMQDIMDRERQTIVSLNGGEKEVRVEVCDCGTGIEEAIKIFSPFFTTKPEGMGMGLSICRSIIESHGGRIEASNNEGFGATFSFTLPVQAAEPALQAERQTSV